MKVIKHYIALLLFMSAALISNSVLANEDLTSEGPIRNPFFLSDELKTFSDVMVGQSLINNNPLVLEATFTRGLVHRAVVSGYIVEEGQQIFDKTIMSISRDRVILADNGQSITLELPKLFDEGK